MTLYWIRETAEDHHAEREPRVIPPPTPPPPCPECGKTFTSSAQLAEHVSLEHPIERPLLFVAGRAAPSEVTVRAALAPNDVIVLGATAIEVSKDGRPPVATDTVGLAELLARHPASTFAIDLSNTRAFD